MAVNKANSLSDIMLYSHYGGLSTNEVRSCYDCDETSLLLLHELVTIDLRCFKLINVRFDSLLSNENVTFVS